VSRAPASNADVGITVAHLMQLDRRSRRIGGGRVLAESLRGSDGKMEPARQYVVESKRSGDDDPTVRAPAGQGFRWPNWRTFTISITPD